MVFDPNKISKELRSALAGPLPGRDAHLRMINYDRPSVKAALEKEKNPKLGAVLILLYPKEEAIHTLLMLRQPYDGVHSAQISLTAK